MYAGAVENAKPEIDPRHTGVHTFLNREFRQQRF